MKERFKEIGERLQAIWCAAGKMPYKWAWLLFMLSSVLLFSWWDELVVWGVGAGWKWQIIPIYYVFEYGVLIPLIIWLGVKTYRKLGMQVSWRALGNQAISASLFPIIWRWLKRRFTKKGGQNHYDTGERNQAEKEAGDQEG